jgi:hypothetical protein
MQALVLLPSHGRLFHCPDEVNRARGSTATVPLPVHFAEPIPPLNMESFLETPNNITSLSCAEVGAGSCAETVIETTKINHTQQSFIEFAFGFLASIGRSRAFRLDNRLVESWSELDHSNVRVDHHSLESIPSTGQAYVFWPK